MPMKYTRFEDIPKFIQHGMYEVDIRPDSLMSTIAEHVKSDGLQLDPDFQRGHVWSTAQQRAYIEFFLRGGKTARVLYFNCPSWYRAANPPIDYNDFVIVDGKQRLEAWRKFFANKLKVFGSYQRDFTDHIRGSTHTMKMNVNDLQSKADVLRWYLDMNSGGTVHSNQDLVRVKKLLKLATSGPDKV